MAKSLPLLALALLSVVGCSNDGQMSKTDESTLKDNFTRSLTPEEMAKMGASKESGPPKDKP